MKMLEKLEQRATAIVNDHQALKDLLIRTKDKLNALDHDDSLRQKMIDYLTLVLRMIINYLKGSYQETPWQTLVMTVAGLLYFVIPLDAIPDFIPVGGFIDDITVLVWLGKCFRHDLARYKKWEDGNSSG